ncbi:MFS transporter [Frankia sp. R82]|uniref:MFS transporter n=1 Tax=Frankia sp. R82 TaxID=2950553 RepID=UPI0020434B49|nr:MFS transporter [Frankia sp. R82]MCM3882913.1 MFS transporter [Frankia sp. R82]
MTASDTGAVAGTRPVPAPPLSSPPQPIPALAATRPPLALLLPVVLGTLLNALNSSMIAVALVAIGDHFHAGASVVWLVSGLYLANAVAQPTMGRLADQFGPRRIFCAGLLMIIVAACAAPFAPTLGYLLIARVLLGVGTSAAYPAGVALVRDWADRTGPEASSASALGAISAASQVAVALGPPLGGVLVVVAGWRSIFWVNLPVAALALVLALRRIRRDARVNTPAGAALRALDPLGIVLFAGGMVFLLLFLFSVAHGPIWLDLVGAALLMLVLVGWERHCASPFIDVRMLASNRPLTATYLRCAVTYVVFYSVFYGLPQWLEQSRRMSSAQAGLVVLPIACLGVVATVLATRMSRRGDNRRLLVIGSVGLLAGSLALLGIGGATPVGVLLLAAAVLGLPNGFNNMGNQTAMYAAAQPERLGTASGLYRTSQYVGANLAAALVGLTLGDHAGSRGLHHLAAVITVISLALVAAAALPARHARASARSHACTGEEQSCP